LITVSNWSTGQVKRTEKRRKKSEYFIIAHLADMSIGSVSVSILENQTNPLCTQKQELDITEKKG